MKNARYVEIVINNKSSHTNTTYTYGIPDDLMDRISIGTRVMVPFGKGNKLIEGYVVDDNVDIEIPAFKVKYIQDIVDEEKLISENLIELCKWMREKYLCTYIDAVQCMIPTGLSYKLDRKIRLNDSYNNGQTVDIRLSDKQKAVVEAIRTHRNITESSLKQILSFEPTSTVKSLVDKGMIVLENHFKNEVNTLTEKIVGLTEGLNIIEALGKLKKNAIKQKQILNYLMENGPAKWSALRKDLGVNGSLIDSLREKGLVKIEVIEKKRDPFGQTEIVAEKKIELTDEQNQVIQQVIPSMMNFKYQPFLIHGITGSGKTEVYMQLIRKAIEQSREAIVLVPEISLTPQMIERFRSRFGNQIAVLHSKLSLGERYDEWNRIKRGEVKIAIGARSAVFAPFDNLGIIIVDEEHEHTYKSEQSPKYHAVEVAEFRCKQRNAILLLGSATPSLESYHKSEKGIYRMLSMENRYNQNKLPDVHIIDMRAELQNGNKSVFSERLYREIHKNLEMGEQTILFLNRRGYSTFISCRSCGYVVKCPHCEISLTYHKNSHFLSCHYCGYKQNPPQLCPKCNSKYIKYFGTGTEKIEKMTQELFPAAKISRLDLDTTSRKGSMEKIIREIRQGKVDIVIGTQMIAKGLDFPNVTLVGVIAADMSLNLPEFRAAERTFQLITQVAGRAGRGERLGRVIVQTYEPEHFAIQASQNHDFVSFYHQEIAVRESFNYPPFSQLINIMITGEKETDVIGLSNEYAAELKYALKNVDITEEIIFGPGPAALARINQKYRWQIIIKSKMIDQNVIRGIINTVRINVLKKNSGNDVNINIDINPFNML
ncbi:MAG: priA [Anaerosolibacter sp.]|jgi:primosomal protein N' (replication factor Y)|uniref:primosomal protein N' n=1 Tax=Anaerosolibacter sp. TaxID=1872527 RepID=UPI0026049F28|nr:primosomal protein N' [Anaerosolibacter sp.]MDF2546844.1 priA [Anaerosolibacter sp.]